MDRRAGEHFDSVLTGARDGADWAITWLYRSVQPALVRYLVARVGDEGEDIASQVWLEVARGLHGFDGDADAFRRWVFCLGHRRLIDHVRARSRRPADTVPDHELARVAGGHDTAADAVDALSGERAAARIVELLPPDLAEVVLLRVVAGMTADEVGKVLGRPAGTVRVQQHRALRRLARELGESGGQL